jgi:hypothetical protein
MTCRVLLVAGALLLFGEPAWALQFLAPAAGAVVKPGASVHVIVLPGAGEPVQELALMVGDASVKATAAASPPGAFEADVLVPLDAIGRLLIIALAHVNDRKGVLEYVAVQVDPGPLRRLSISAPPSMTVVGQLFPVEVTGLFEDGMPRNLTAPDRGTTYSSTNDAVLGVDPSGLIQARTRGVALVVATNRGVQTTASVSVQVPDPPTNHIPVPDPGSDRIVAPEQVVLLSAAASHDPDGDPLQYRWEQRSGEAIALRGDDTIEASFISPIVRSDEVLAFSLVVIDSKGASSLPAIVRVTVRP